MLFLCAVLAPDIYVVCRYNKPLLPKYEAAERNVQLKQQAIEKKIAGRRINQVHLSLQCTAHT